MLILHSSFMTVNCKLSDSQLQNKTVPQGCSFITPGARKQQNYLVNLLQIAAMKTLKNFHGLHLQEMKILCYLFFTRKAVTLLVLLSP